MFREDLYNTYITFRGKGAGSPTGTGVFTCQVDKHTGGNAKGKDVKYRPANGLTNELALGGPKTIDNDTLSMLYREEVDSWVDWLMRESGSANVEVVKQPINDAGENWGHSLNYKGKLLDVNPPAADSMGDKAAVIEFVCSLESELA